MNNEEFKDRIIAEHGGVADDTTPLFGSSAFVNLPPQLVSWKIRCHKNNGTIEDRRTS